MTDQNTDHAQLVAGDHNYSDSRWRESYLTRPYYQEAQLTTPDLDYDRDFLQLMNLVIGLVLNLRKELSLKTWKVVCSKNGKNSKLSLA